MKTTPSVRLFFCVTVTGKQLILIYAQVSRRPRHHPLRHLAHPRPLRLHLSRLHRLHQLLLRRPARHPVSPSLLFYPIDNIVLIVTLHSANISPEWKAAYVKAEAAVAKLNLTDKVSLATGIGWEVGNCVGNTLPIESIGFPGLCLEGAIASFSSRSFCRYSLLTHLYLFTDSPVGVRYADLVSAFPPGINVAAT